MFDVILAEYSGIGEGTDRSIHVYEVTSNIVKPVFIPTTYLNFSDDHYVAKYNLAYLFCAKFWSKFGADS